MVAPYYFKSDGDRKAEKEKATTCVCAVIERTLFLDDEKIARGDGAEHAGKPRELCENS